MFNTGDIVKHISYGKRTVLDVPGVGYVVKFDDGKVRRITDGLLKRIRGENMNYSALLKQKGFELNTYPEGKYWELQITEDEGRKIDICRAFQADIELFDSSRMTDIDTLILQCAEDFTKCLFYYDCNPFDMSTEDFMKCVEKI